MGPVTAWIGGRLDEEKGVWQWSDGSPWNFTDWLSGKVETRPDWNCVLVKPLSVRPTGNWGTSYSSSDYPFVCQLKPNIIQRSTVLNFQYHKEQLTFPTFEVWYSYKVTSPDIQNSQENKQNTRFRLTWKMEDLPTQEVTIQEVGTMVKTPGFGQSSFNGSKYMVDHAYKSQILFQKDLKKQVNSGSLVIQLEVDIREEEGWKEEVVVTEQSKWGREKYKMFAHILTWEGAEVICKEWGGHLASLKSEKDQQEILAFIKKTQHNNEFMVWLGATDVAEEGVWQWADGSPWTYTNWKRHFGNRGQTRNCVFMNQDGIWKDASCTGNSFIFVCQTKSMSLRKNTSITLEYTMDQLTFPSLEVLYTFTFKNQELLDSWEDKRMTGFKLDWFVQDRNKTRLTEIKSDEPLNWEPEAAIPKF